MKYSDFGYVDCAIGAVSHRNNVVHIGQVRKMLPENPVDCYCTWHRFPQLYQCHWEHNIRERNGATFRSTANFKGPSYADFVPFDFDAESLAEAQKMLRDFLGYLDVTYGLTRGMRVHFSGNRGFHVCLPSSLFGGWYASEALPGRLKQLAMQLSGDIGIDKAVYDQNRLWRIPGTRHSKGGLWKIELTPGEATTMPPEEIQAKAQVPGEKPQALADDEEPLGGLVELWQSICEKTEEARASVAASSVFSTDLKEGDGRQEKGFQLARQLKGWGVPPHAALEVLRLWDGALVESLEATDGQGEIQRIVENAYGSAEGPVIRISPDAVRSIAELAEDYQRHIESLKNRVIRLGFPRIDRMMRGICAGEVCTVIAKTSVGKTALAQNVLRSVGRDQQTHSLFLSMEQPKAQVFERWAQMAMRTSGREIEKGWAEETFRIQVMHRLQTDVGNRIWTCDLPHLKPEEIEVLAWTAQDKCGHRLGLLVIDYLGLLDAKALDRTLYGQISEAARGLKTLAKKLDVAVIALCQISRSPDDHGNKQLHISSARESGAIEESADFMLGLYRPNIERPDGHADDTMVIQLLKNRKGKTGAAVCNFDGATLTITERSGGEEDDAEMEDASRTQGSDSVSAGGRGRTPVPQYRESSDRPQRPELFDPDKDPFPF